MPRIFRFTFQGYGLEPPIFETLEGKSNGMRTSIFDEILTLQVLGMGHCIITHGTGGVKAEPWGSIKS